MRNRLLVAMMVMLTVLCVACGSIVETRTPKPTESEPQSYHVSDNDGQIYLVTIHDVGDATLALVNANNEIVKEVRFTYDGAVVDEEIMFDDGSVVTISGDPEDSVTIVVVSSNGGDGEAENAELPQIAMLADDVGYYSPVYYAEPQIPTPGHLQKISAHDEHGCGIDNDGVLWCWMSSEESFIANILTVGEANTIAPLVSSIFAGTAQDVYVRKDAIYITTGDGELVVIGSDAAYANAANALPFDAVSMVRGDHRDAHQRTTCAVDSEALLYCWSQQLGMLTDPVTSNVASLAMLPESKSLVVKRDGSLVLVDIVTRTEIHVPSLCYPESVAASEHDAYLVCSNGDFFTQAIDRLGQSHGRFREVLTDVHSVAANTSAAYVVSGAQQRVSLVVSNRVYENMYYTGVIGLAVGNTDYVFALDNDGTVLRSALKDELLTNSAIMPSEPQVLFD